METVFVAALSFEPRAAAAYTEWLSRRSLRRKSGLLLLDYQSTATKGPAAASLREARYSEFVDLSKRESIPVIRVPVDAHSSRNLSRTLEKYVLAAHVSSVVLDISCLTRPHLIASAAFFAEIEPGSLDWSIAYTSPRSYGESGLRGDASRLQDTLSLPLAMSTRLRNQGLTLGILLLGFDSSRVGLALDEIEPSAGIIIAAGRKTRPDFAKAADDYNSLAISHLQSLRLSGPRSRDLAVALGADGWKLLHLNLDDDAILTRVASACADLYRAASVVTPRAPIALFPFGPKSLGFALAYNLASLGGDSVIAVIPTYRTHAVDYSEGVLSTSFYTEGQFSSAFRASLE